MTSPVTADRPGQQIGSDDDPAFLRGPVQRTMLAILSVLLLLLASVLTLAALDVTITRGAILVALSGFALVALVALASLSRRAPRAPRTRIPARTVVGALATVVVLLASIAVARALQPTTVERFVSLQSTTTAGAVDGVLSVRPGATVELGWQLRGYGVELTTAPTVEVTVDSAVPEHLTSVVSVPTEPGTSASELSGHVTFTAPSKPGRHRVVLQVADPADPAGGQELVLQLEATS